MFIHYCSDLHLSEIGRYIEDSILVSEKKNDNILVLAGDICLFHYTNHIRMVKNENYDKGWKGIIDWCVDNFFLTIFVPGNHDFFKATLEEGKQFCEWINSYGNNNFICLYNQDHKISLPTGKILKIIGSTLWTSININKINFLNNNDTDKIENWSLEKHNDEHEVCLSFIKNSINEAKKNGEKILVITHHSPSIYNTSNFFYTNVDSNVTYASSLDDVLMDADIWIFGHTHWNINHLYKSKDKNTWLLSNCQGKKNENTGIKYNKNCKFEIIS